MSNLTPAMSTDGLEDLLGTIPARVNATNDNVSVLDQQDTGPLDRPLRWTLFDGPGAAVKHDEQDSLRQMVPALEKQTADAKATLPWIKLARFGDTRSAKGSLRYDGNVLTISGIEADYDGEAVAMGDAARLLRHAGIAALLYTSPSHTDAAPRWRVLCPLAADLTGTPAELRQRRAELVGRVNGVLGGVLSSESFTLSQSYYAGSVNSNPAHRVVLISGDAIDQRHDLPAVGVPAQHAKVAAPAGTVLDTPSAIARASSAIKAELQKHGEPAEGAGSDNRAYALAAEVRDLGLSTDRATDLLHAEWAPHFDREWIESKASNANRYSQNEPGAWAVGTAADSFGHTQAFRDALYSDEAIRAEFLPPKEDDSGADWGEPTPLAAYMGETAAPAVRMLAPGWIEAGMLVKLDGAGGVHKSRLLLQLDLALVYRLEWLPPSADWRVTGTPLAVAYVLILSYENQKDETERRIQAMVKRLGLRDKDRKATLDIWELRKKGRPPMLTVKEGDGPALTRFGCKVLRRLKAQRAANPDGHIVLHLDSMFNAIRFEGAAKNNDALVKQVIDMLDHWCDTLDMTIITPFHPSRAGSARDDSGFSAEFDNAPRQVLDLKERHARVAKQVQRDGRALVRGTGTYDLTVRKWNNGRQGVTVNLEFADGIMRPTVTVGGTHTAAEVAAGIALGLDHGTDRLRRGGKGLQWGAGKGVPFTRGNPGMTAFQEKTANPGATVADLRAALDKAVSMGLLDYAEASKGGSDPHRAGYCFPASALGADPWDNDGQGQDDEETEDC